jgi:hypothetical protein
MRYMEVRIKRALAGCGVLATGPSGPSGDSGSPWIRFQLLTARVVAERGETSQWSPLSHCGPYDRLGLLVSQSW